MLPWARALILYACGPECEFPFTFSGKSQARPALL